MKKLLIGTGLAALLSVPAIAQPQSPQPSQQRTVTRAEVQSRIAGMFAKLDANKDGAVTRAEFDAHRSAMKSERQANRAQRRAELFATLDADKNGQLSRDEFSTPRQKVGGDQGRDHRFGMRGHHRGFAMRGKGQWLERLDANKDGKVTLAEATAKPLAHFDRVDVNRDGRISPEERKAARDASRQQRQAKRG